MTKAEFSKGFFVSRHGQSDLAGFCSDGRHGVKCHKDGCTKIVAASSSFEECLIDEFGELLVEIRVPGNHNE